MWSFPPRCLPALAPLVREVALCPRPCAGDMRAAWVSAVIMLPQAVAFAVLAGLPPEMGIYASVVPVIVAAWLGASSRLLCGPNTAVSIMIGAALLPLAVPGSSDYIALAVALTVMVGVIQIGLALLGMGRLLSALPPFVSSGMSLGIGLLMICSQLAPASGLLPVPSGVPWLSAVYAALGWQSINPYAVAVAACAIAAGLAVARFPALARQPLVVAIAGGTAAGVLLNFLAGAATADLDSVGQLEVALFAWSVPSFSWDEWYVLKQLAHSAAAIAVVGGLQTVIISRSLTGDAASGAAGTAAAGSQGDGDPRRELLAQGAANISAAFTGGFAGSGSFNRTAAHVTAGAQTRLAAMLCSLVLLAMAWLGGPLFACIPTAAVAGTIALIGWGMLRSGFKAARTGTRWSRAANAAIALSALAGGVEASLIVATLLGLLDIVLARQPGSGASAHAAR